MIGASESLDIYARLRAARNRSMYREINERARTDVPSFASPPEPVEHAFVCECGSPECCDYIDLEIAEYEHVRSGIDRLAVLPEHAVAGQRVLERCDRYVIVEPASAGLSER